MEEKNNKEGNGKKKIKESKRELYVAVRTRGLVGVPVAVRHTLHMLRLRQKFSCILLQGSSDYLGMLKKVKDYISYGPIKSDVLKKLLSQRGRMIGNKPIKLPQEKFDAIVGDLISLKMEPTDLEKFDIKSFFRLHPPRGGFKKETRLPWPKGILGDVGNYINDIISKML